MSTNLKWSGEVTALSSISHGEQTLGVVTYLRRERFVMPDNTTEDIPVVSGNAWRGLLRRVSADLWWEAVGRPKLTIAVTHAIWSGGALAKSVGVPLTGTRLLRLREVCPPVGLFGAAGGGRIMDGCVQVGKLIPICQETRHILPDGYALDDLPSIWDLTQIEYYSKIPTDSRDKDSRDTEESDYTPMRYGYETFVAGTRFHTTLGATWATPVEAALLVDALAEYGKAAHVGGLGRSGHGELRLNLELVKGENEITALPDWRASVQGNKDLLSVLAWLD